MPKWMPFPQKGFFQNAITSSDPGSTKLPGSLEQGPQGSGHGTRPVRVQEEYGRCSESYGLVSGSPARNRGLDLVIFMGPFQLETMYDSIWICHQHCRVTKLGLEVNIVCCSWLCTVFKNVYNTVLPAGLNMYLYCKLAGLNDILS